MSLIRIGKGGSAADPTVHLGMDGSDLIQTPTNPSRPLFGFKSEQFNAEMDGRIDRTTRVVRGCTTAPPDLSYSDIACASGPA